MERLFCFRRGNDALLVSILRLLDLWDFEMFEINYCHDSYQGKVMLLISFLVIWKQEGEEDSESHSEGDKESSNEDDEVSLAPASRASSDGEQSFASACDTSASGQEDQQEEEGEEEAIVPPQVGTRARKGEGEEAKEG